MRPSTSSGATALNHSISSLERFFARSADEVSMTASVQYPAQATALLAIFGQNTTAVSNAVISYQCLRSFTALLLSPYGGDIAWPGPLWWIGFWVGP